MGEGGLRQRNHRKARPETDQRRRRDRKNRRRGSCQEREAGRRLPRREGEGVQLPGRSGDEGDPGQGESRAGERDSEAEAGRLAEGIYRLGDPGFPLVSSTYRRLSSSYLALIVLISFFFASSSTIWFLISISLFAISCLSLKGMGFFTKNSFSASSS